MNKPTGITSADVVRLLKKKMNPTKIGHAGTLDPDATGLIPLALGEATKAIPSLRSRKKAKLLFLYGLKTDTDDPLEQLQSLNLHSKKNEILKPSNIFRGAISSSS